VSFPSESGDEHLVVFLDVGEASVAGHERGHLLAVFDELHAHALANGRVGLLRLNAAEKKTQFAIDLKNGGHPTFGACRKTKLVL